MSRELEQAFTYMAGLYQMFAVLRALGLPVQSRYVRELDARLEARIAELRDDQARLLEARAILVR